MEYLSGTYPITTALLGGILGAIVITIAFKIRKARISKQDIFCEVEVFLKEQRIQVKAMLDTGNLLKEPMTGMPVIVIEKNQMEKLLPEKVLTFFAEIMQGKEYPILESEYVSRMRLIPFSSIGKQNGMLLGFRPDQVVICWEEQKITKKNVMIGIYEKSLTKNGAYTALIRIRFDRRRERK